MNNENLLDQPDNDNRPMRVKNDPTWIDGKMNSSHSETYIGTAAVIVGCLVAQDYMKIDLEEVCGDEKYMNALRLVAAVLRRIHPMDEGADWPDSIVRY